MDDYLTKPLQKADPERALARLPTVVLDPAAAAAAIEIEHKRVTQALASLR